MKPEDIENIIEQWSNTPNEGRASEQLVEISFKAGYQEGVKNHHECCKMDYKAGEKQGGRETAEEIFEWGEEVCSGHEGYQYSLKRRQCGLCWQELKSRIGE